MSFEKADEITPIQVPARESEILSMAAKGMTDKQIAAELGISRDTVGTYWRRILLRFNASSRTEVVARATETEHRKRVTEAEQESARLMQEIHERSAAQAKELAQRNLLTTVQEALLAYVAKAPNTEAIFESLLRETLVISQAEFGFIAETSLEKSGTPLLRTLVMTNIAWDKQSQDQYEAQLSELYQACNEKNLVGSIITSRRPIISNDPDKDPRSGGLPAGHPKIRCFLGIPLHAGEEMVGIISIANRPDGFSDETILDLAPIVSTCGAIISGMKTEGRRFEAQSASAYTLDQLNAFVESMAAAVMVVDADRKIKVVNPAFCKEFMPGLKPKEVVGLPSAGTLADFGDIIVEPKNHIKLVEQMIQDGKVVRELPVRTSDGREFSCDFIPLRRGSDDLGHVWKLRRVR